MATHTLALLVYPGLLTIVAFGFLAEMAHGRLVDRAWKMPDLHLRRRSAASSVVALCAMLAVSQVAAPFNPIAPDERNLLLATMAIAFMAWAEPALSPGQTARPPIAIAVQVCWLIAVLAPAFEPQDLRPQVLGAVFVAGLLPLKIACGFLYVMCLPALLHLWPVVADGERRSRARFDTVRALSWLPYCGLFASLYFSPGAPDLGGVARFALISSATAAVVLLAGIVLRRQSPATIQRAHRRIVLTFAFMVLVLALVTTVLSR